MQAIALINSGLNIVDTWPIIKYNLDYIFYGYNSATCDLWEEIVSNDFFWNKVTMPKALSLGSELAYKMGYMTDAENWLYLSNQIKESIYSLHWNGYYYYESTNRPIDGAVIIGLNNGYDDKDNFLNPLSYEVASTVYYYNLAFSSEYSINFSDMDFYGILYGRYPEIEGWGYSALWTPEAVGRDPFSIISRLAASTTKLVFATGIANIYARDAMTMRAIQQTVGELSGGRFVLGLGVSHAPMVAGLRGHTSGKPVATMRAYLDALEKATYLGRRRPRGRRL